ncbi:hypothetical protein ACIRS1_07325 [Kitasatospora sp. NPDC101176]|uniref:hypothetical protein n=1 Tax=Kitasatospora sp. NPDC101176 TaxID=3364099 RepID=UPI00382AFA25
MTATTAVRWRRRTVQGLLGGAVVLAALGLVGDRCSEDGGLLTPAELFHHPLLFGTLIAGALLAAVLIGVRDIVVRALTTVVAVLLGLLASPFYILAGDGTRTSMHEAAPGRDDRHLVVEEGSAMIARSGGSTSTKAPASPNAGGGSATSTATRARTP